jgi:protein-tyrosine phosphatase
VGRPATEALARDHFGMSLWFRTYGFAEILDDLVIGAFPVDAEDVAMLAWLTIDRVVNLVQDEEYRDGDREAVVAALAAATISERRIKFTDFGNLPAEGLEAAVQEVCQGLQEGHRTYLHCRAGQQRSAIVAAGVVALRQGVDVDEALEFVQQRKPSAAPLPHQVEDLRRWWTARNQASDEPQNAERPGPDPGDSEDLLGGP